MCVLNPVTIIGSTQCQLNIIKFLELCQLMIFDQVIFSICSSGSMYGRPLLIARIAVAELIDTLSENDFFNLIWVGT